MVLEIESRSLSISDNTTTEQQFSRLKKEKSNLGMENLDVGVRKIHFYKVIFILINIFLINLQLSFKGNMLSTLSKH